MDIGLEVVKIHDVHDQNKFLEPLIWTNIKQNTATQCLIKSKPFKLTNNAIYGKSLYNITKYGGTYRYVNNENPFSLFIYLKHITRLGQDRVICSINMPKLIVNKPLYLIFQIHEIANKKLYYFWYKVLKPH